MEIKCPISYEKCPVVDLKNKKSNVSYLRFGNGVPELYTKHQYYIQCQVQLYVTGLSTCDLYVWSPKGSCCVPVYKDEILLKALIPKLESFYFSNFLKALKLQLEKIEINESSAMDFDDEF